LAAKLSDCRGRLNSSSSKSKWRTLWNEIRVFRRSQIGGISSKAAGWGRKERILFQNRERARQMMTSGGGVLRNWLLAQTTFYFVSENGDKWLRAGLGGTFQILTKISSALPAATETRHKVVTAYHYCLCGRDVSYIFEINLQAATVRINSNKQ
jgi:hypothetical protein